MPDYDNRNSGLLFKSTSDNPKAPAFSGFWTDENNNQIKIKAYWSKNPDKNGNDFLQVSEDKYEKDEITVEEDPAGTGQTRRVLTQSGYDKAKQARDTLATPQDSPINLDDIPF